MTIAIINTDMNIGPFKIPGNGQNMILNNYAERNNIVVEEIIPEPFMSNALVTTQWTHKKKKLKKVILCSIIIYFNHFGNIFICQIINQIIQDVPQRFVL